MVEKTPNSYDFCCCFLSFSPMKTVNNWRFSRILHQHYGFKRLGYIFFTNYPKNVRFRKEPNLLPTGRIFRPILNLWKIVGKTVAKTFLPARRPKQPGLRISSSGRTNAAPSTSGSCPRHPRFIKQRRHYNVTVKGRIQRRKTSGASVLLFLFCVQLFV